MAKYKNVRVAMVMRDLTYAKLSKITGFSASRISDAVNGTRPVADKVRRSIAMALGMSYEWLWTLETEQTACDQNTCAGSR